MVFFIAIGPNYWGRGHSVEEARLQLRKAGGDLRKAHAVYELPAGAIDPWVDDFGGTRWTWAEGADRSDPRLTVRYVKGLPMLEVGAKV